jgi:hypothetical protein
VAQQEGAADLTRLFAAKAAAERAEADALDPGSAERGSSGPASAAVLLVKGEPASAAAVGSALSPAEAEAALRALTALGLPGDDVSAIATRTPQGSDDSSVRRLRLAVEAGDPAWVIALDRLAGEAVAAALEVSALVPGQPLTIAGRVWLVVDGLEASLTDPALKRRVWEQMKALTDGRQEISTVRRKTH